MADPEAPGTELYALLHVPRTASDDDVKRAYRQLATVYHPDKYTSPQMQAVASENFQRIKKAFDVLSDPRQRQVYDLYGEEGLTSGLELGPRLKTGKEIRDEYERLQVRRQELKRTAHTNQTGSVLMSLTLAETLKNLDKPPQVSGMQMGSQVQAGLSEKDMVVLGASMVARRGIGGGTIHGVWKRTVSPHASFEVLAMTGLRSVLGFTSSRQLTKHVNATLGLSCNLRDGELTLTNGWTRQMSPSTLASIQFGLGPEGGLGLGWQHQVTKGSFSADLKLGETMVGVSGSYIRRFSEKSSGRVTARLGPNGIDMEIGGSRRLSEHSSAGWFCSIGLQGIVWKIRYTRGGQKFVFPIMLWPSLRPSIAFGGLFIPSALYAALKIWVFKPYALRRRKRKELQQRRENLVEVTAARKAAFEAQELLSAPAERKRQAQELKDGLIITGASYGNLQLGQSSTGGGRGQQEEEEAEGLPPPYLDVTTPLQFFVDDSGGRDAFLVLHEGIRKRGLMGFCDPCPGEEKMLRVSYTFQRQPHKVVVGDFEELRIPQNSHRVEERTPGSVNQVD